VTDRIVEISNSSSAISVGNGIVGKISKIEHRTHQ